MTRRCWSSCPGRASARASGWRCVGAPSRRRPRPRRRRAPTPAARARGRAQALRRARGERAPDRGRREQRADHVRAAALVLPRARLAVLVAADRDVLGAVVLGEVGAAQRDHRRAEREDGGDRLLRQRREPRPRGRPAIADHAPGHRAEHAGPLERELRLGQAPPHLAGGARRSRPPAPGRAARRLRTSTERSGFSPDGDLQLAVLGAHGARPVARPVHEDAVREGHAPEPDRLLFAHRPRVAARRARRNRTPSSRSSTAMRSSAEWMSLAATSGSIVRMGKKP